MNDDADSTLTIFMDRWAKIRAHFTAEERAKLNGAVCGEIICPKGAVVDVYHLGVELTRKLRAALKEETASAS